MRRLRPWVERLAAGFALLGGLLLLAIALVSTVNAAAFTADRVARLLGATVAALPGYEDFVRLAVSAAALMLLPWCQHRRGHVAVDLFANLLPRAAQRGLDVAGTAGTCALALFLAGWMWAGMLETRDDGVLSRVLGWPEWPFYLPGVLSLLLWAAVAALQLAGREGDGRA